jgi:hypothetical protein
VAYYIIPQFIGSSFFFHLVHVFKLRPFYICCSIAAADISRSLVWISNVRHLKHHGIISFTTGYWYNWYPSTMLRNLKFHSLAWESDRQVSATECYCSIIFISDLNEPPLKIRKKRTRVVNRRAQCLAICSLPVALMFPRTQFNVLSSQLSSPVPKWQRATLRGTCFKFLFLSEEN